MKARLFTPEDYPTIKGWWEGHGVPPVPIEHLPHIGVIVENDTGMLAAVWVIEAKCIPWALAIWPVTSPHLLPFASEEVVRYLIGAAEELAKSEGCRVFNVFTEKNGLCKWLERSGFTKSSEQVNTYIKAI
jgi:hypothetical protein